MFSSFSLEICLQTSSVDITNTSATPLALRNTKSSVSNQQTCTRNLYIRLRRHNLFCSINKPEKSWWLRKKNFSLFGLQISILTCSPQEKNEHKKKIYSAYPFPLVECRQYYLSPFDSFLLMCLYRHLSRSNYRHLLALTCQAREGLVPNK